MKNRSVFSVFFLILVIFGLLAACSNPASSGPSHSSNSNPPGSNPSNPGSSQPDSNYTVSFEANGGDPAPDPQTITNGGKVVQPPTMTKTGYGFGGWYKEAACTNQWDFSADTVSGNITLYAQWNFSGAVVSGETLADKLAWLKTNAERDSAYLLEVTTAYEDLPSQDLSYTGRNNITILLKGIGSSRVIEFSGRRGSLFSIGNVTLILDENLILQGNSDNSASLIKVNSGGTLIMNGGEISGSSRGGVEVGRSGTFTMSGGEISGNTRGGVYVDGGTFTMSGGEISGNTRGGVYVDGGTFTMSGGEISGNTSSSYGGGVYVGGGTFTKSGGGTITGYASDTVKGNVVKQNGVVQSNQGHAVYVSGGLTMRRETTAGPGVNLDPNKIGAAGGWENNLGGLATELSWLQTNAANNTTYTFEVTADEDLGSCTLSYSGKTNVTIVLKGDTVMRTVNLSNNGSLFSVSSGVTLILDKNLTLRGHSGNNSQLVYVNGGTLVMREGSVITGNTSSYGDGGGVYVGSSGTFTMSGGEISGNSSRGVYVDGGTFTMSGGEISGNTSSSYGGGVYVNGGTFTMSGGEISGNTAAYGGGVYVDGGTFTKSGGGTITGYASDTVNGNVVKQNGVVQSNQGHAVFADNGNSRYIKRKETTAGPGDNLSYNRTVDSPVWDGAWDF